MIRSRGRFNWNPFDSFSSLLFRRTHDFATRVTGWSGNINRRSIQFILPLSSFHLSSTEMPNYHRAEISVLIICSVIIFVTMIFMVFFPHSLVIRGILTVNDLFTTTKALITLLSWQMGFLRLHIDRFELIVSNYLLIQLQRDVDAPPPTLRHP